MARKLSLYNLVFVPVGPRFHQLESAVLFRAKNHNQARRRAREKCDEIGGRAKIQVHSLQCGVCCTEGADSLSANLGHVITAEEAAHFFKPKRAVSFNPALDYGEPAAAERGQR